MLEVVRDALCDVGVLRVGDPMPPFSVRMSGNLVFLVYPPGRNFYLVKVGLLGDLQREYDGFAAGHAAFPNGVPKPLALARHRSLSTLVTLGIPFDPLGPRSMQAPSPLLERALAHYFSTAATAFRAETGISHSHLIRAAFESLPADVDPDTWAGYIDRLGNKADQLPMVLQHGDFYSNNLGLHGDALVVLDWEDFGLVRLPGYDLALLLLSLNSFNPGGVRMNTVEDAPHFWILRAGTQASGLDPGLFFQLMPAYLATIAKIKQGRGYDVKLGAGAIRAMIDALRHDDCE